MAAKQGLLRLLATDSPDFDNVIDMYNKKRGAAADLVLTKEEENELTRLKYLLSEIGIPNKDEDLFKITIVETLQKKRESLELERNFLTLLQEFELFHGEYVDIEEKYKEVHSFPSKSSLNSFLLDSWKYLRLLHTNVTDIEALIQAQAPEFPKMLYQWVDNKIEQLLGKLTKILFFSQEVYLSRDTDNKLDPEALKKGALWFRLDLSTVISMMNDEIEPVYSERLRSTLCRCIEKKTIHLIQRHGHVLSFLFKQDVGAVEILVKKIENFDPAVIEALKSLSGFLQQNFDCGLQGRLSAIGVIDAYLEMIAESEFIDNQKYILAHKTQFDQFIGFRNSLIPSKEELSAAGGPSLQKRPTTFEEAFRECGFESETSKDSEAQLLLWNLFGKLCLLKTDISNRRSTLVSCSRSWMLLSSLSKTYQQHYLLLKSKGRF